MILFSGKTIDKTNLPHEIRDNSLRKRPGDGFTLPDSGICLDELEASMIHQALDKARGNQSRAAKLLGVTRSTLIYRMKKFAIQ